MTCKRSFELFRVLSGTSSRWKHLSLYGYISLLHTLLVQEPPLPLLQAIHIQLILQVDKVSSIFRNASSLAHLTAPLDVLLHFERPLQLAPPLRTPYFESAILSNNHRGSLQALDLTFPQRSRSIVSSSLGGTSASHQSFCQA